MNDNPSPQEVPSSPGIPPAEDRDLPPGRRRVLREHLMREIDSGAEHAASARRAEDTEDTEDTEGNGPSVRQFWRRPAFVAPAVAATLTVAVVVGSTVAQNATTPPKQGADSATGRRGGIPSDESATALLERIAAAAGKRTLPPVRDDQFVYTEQEDYHWKADGALPTVNCAMTLEGHPYGVREIWASVDGRRAGLSRLYEGDDKVTNQPLAEQLPGKDQVNFFREAEDELPTDTEKMYRYLYGLKSGERPSGKASADRDAFDKAAALLSGQLLPSKAEAALYRAVARIPGLTVERGSEDAAGRTGMSVGIEGAYPGDFAQSRSRHELLFDTKTLDFLALNSINLDTPDDDCEVLDVGDLVSSVAVLRRGVVDETGQRP
ncbi:CU044_5270 family protein [Streptomyces scabiei]|uniref:CU044_5270 family protein n=1 Tax=Streptomyces scabiei TaxID=1930 RepID=UPI000A391B71|nr:CU044_5270 family protein [Streptomyces scabiei]